VARFQTFDIVVVPFPYSDRLAEKRRPAIVVSNPNLENLNGLVWVAMVTSSDTGSSGATALTDIAETGLERASFVRAAKIATVETSRIVRKVGQLSDADAANLQDELRRLSGF
jgi:mRNA interferase MazF